MSLYQNTRSGHAHGARNPEYLPATQTNPESPFSRWNTDSKPKSPQSIFPLTLPVALQFAMRVHSAVALVFLLISAFSLPQHPSPNDRSTNERNEDANAHKHQSSSKTSMHVGSTKSTSKNADEAGTKQTDPDSRIYKVDVVSKPPEPKDTPLFPRYLWITGIGVAVTFTGVIVNAAIWCLIWQQTKANVVAAKAAKESAKAAQASVNSIKSMALIYLAHQK